MRTSFALLSFAALLLACHGPTDRYTGQSNFVSAPFPTQNGAGGGGAGGSGGGSGTQSTNDLATRTVVDTDLYRLDGARLYYLNAYRGLMVFDVSNVDQPKLVGRSAIFGSPVEMLVRNGIAIVVVADWYGQMDDGTPFHGSIVRGLDATDPSNIKVLGEAKLGGLVRDTRVVGDVLYAVSEDFKLSYNWAAGQSGPGFSGGGGSGGGGGGIQETGVIVSSVSFANNVISAVASVELPGFDGIFNVAPKAILLAHNPGPPYEFGASASDAVPRVELIYLDISDPNGGIVQRGKITVDGAPIGTGHDNGRWNLDFADGKMAHVVGCAGGPYCLNGYLVDTVDFTNPDAPVLASELKTPATGWQIAARFDGTDLYLSPAEQYNPNVGGTPFYVYDLSDPTAPKLIGSAAIAGTVSSFLPGPPQYLFGLGDDWGSFSGGGVALNALSLKYVDVSNPAAPKALGSAVFGNGLDSTTAAQTFKAFTFDATKGLALLPFGRWDINKNAYDNGVRLIEFTSTTERTAGAALTHGWVERGIFVGNRVVALSDLALAVVDYTNPDAPVVTAELTLARNVVATQPQNTTIAEVSSDWWENDVTSSDVRLLAIANADETTDDSVIASTHVDGVNARVFRNGDLAYVVTDVRVAADCSSGSPSDPQCWARSQQIQVVDLSGQQALLRGKVSLPTDPWDQHGWRWVGFYWWDWYDGAEIVQVANDALVVRHPGVTASCVGSSCSTPQPTTFYVVDLSNADAPSVASVVNSDDVAWWGHMVVAGQTVYTSEYEWLAHQTGTARYYVSRIDLSNRAHPVAGGKINVPGILVGGSPVDSSIIFTIDYRSGDPNDEFDVVQLHGSTAELLSHTALDGWAGTPIVRGAHVYMSTEIYGGSFGLKINDIDISDPRNPVNHASTTQNGWGWLLAVEGGRAVVTSGWGVAGVDVYQLVDGGPPKFQQFVRTRGWRTDSVSRQDSTLFLTSGYWGVQRIALQ